MLVMRLQRIGRRGDPAFRIVVQDSKRSPKSGRVVEVLGSYNPHKKYKVLDTERALYWIKNGAQASGTVHNILVDENVVSARKKNVLPKKRPIAREAEAQEKPEKTEEAGGSEKDTEEVKPAETASEEGTSNESVHEEQAQGEASVEEKEETTGDEDKGNASPEQTDEPDQEGGDETTKKKENDSTEEVSVDADAEAVTKKDTGDEEKEK